MEVSFKAVFLSVPLYEGISRIHVGGIRPKSLQFFFSSVLLVVGKLTRCQQFSILHSFPGRVSWQEIYLPFLSIKVEI
jgi:hypothetical protein